MRFTRIARIALALMLAMPMMATAADKVSLTFGSWRTDDVEKVNAIIAIFNKTNPDIQIKFDPTNPPDYNATLRLQLENGTGPDIYYARSYDTGRELFKAGYMLDLSKESFLSKFDKVNVGPWTTLDGKVFGLPLAAVSHGIYYNQKIFKDNGIAVPTTWEDLIAAAKKLKDKGITPFANGLKDEWDVCEVVWMNIAPSFVGADGRVAYETGKRAFNDDAIVSVFKAVQDLGPYLPNGFQAVDYNGMHALFNMGKAAMFFDGSWSIPDVEKAAPAFDWGVFAIPAPKGKKSVVTFHPDAGVAINPASKNIAAAKVFLAWLAGPDGAKAIGDNMTGLFPMSKNAITLSNKYANAFLAFNKDRATDVRFTWPMLMSGKPSAYDLVMNGSIAILNGKKTPKAAADDLASGLAQWYKPAK
jgi:raffinose/stachyose/melibiose transport system substrate-binding protein